MNGKEPAPPVFVHVSQKILEQLKQKLASGEEILAREIRALQAVEDAPPEDLLVPVDVSERLNRTAALAADPKADAESYIKAEALFNANASGLAEKDRPVPMTAREWQNVELQAADDDEEEVSLVDEEPEDEFDDGEEEGVDDDDEDEVEPAAKRPKSTSASSSKADAK
mmetsp:Transcript_18898/g.34159  ORF Transcript_18898/g.34159 Transcript_18898/m.34159 type:complete len:169 (+) Transcript_18898:47-553(+)